MRRREEHWNHFRSYFKLWLASPTDSDALAAVKSFTLLAVSRHRAPRKTNDGCVLERYVPVISWPPIDRTVNGLRMVVNVQIDSELKSAKWIYLGWMHASSLCLLSLFSFSVSLSLPLYFHISLFELWISRITSVGTLVCFHAGVFFHSSLLW